MRRTFAFTLLTLLLASAASADVSLVERRTLHQKSARATAKAVAKAAKAGKPGRPVTSATGSQGLIDSQGVKYFINTNITFSTTSSASGAMSEASYTHSVAATTLNGGTTSSQLNDAFDGYNTMCLSLDNTIANCETGNANFVIYNRNGAAATTECPGTTSGVNRQVVLPVQTAGNIQMFRKVFVPDNDTFGRWLNYYTNTGASPQTVTVVIANNLGSDANTVVVTTSNGTTTPDNATTWVSSFQNYSGTTSSDGREGHVLQGAGAATPLAGIHFVDGDDNPYWGYTFTLNPGETKILANFVAIQPSKSAAAAKAAELTGLPTNALQCVSDAERAEITNFAAALPIEEVPTLSEVGLVSLILLLAGAALWLMARKRVAVRG